MPRTLHLVLLTGFALACSRSGPELRNEFAGPPGSGQPSLFATDDARVLMTWFERDAENEHVLRISERVNGRWQASSVVARGSPFFVNWADFPSVVEATNGTWVVHWLEKVAEDPYAYHIKVVTSNDRGQSWSEPVVPHGDRSPTEHGFVSMVPWDDGVALIWLDGRAMQGHGEEPRGAMTVRATTFSIGTVPLPDVLLDDRTCECCATSIVRTTAGLLAAYRDRSEGEIRDIAVVRYDGERWSAPSLVAEDRWHYPGCPVNGPQLTAVGDSVAIAWFTAPNDTPRVFVAFSSDAGSTFGTPIRIDDGMPRGRVDVVFDAGGRTLLVTWLEATPDGGEIRARRVTRGGPVESSWAVGRTDDARASGFPQAVRAAQEIVFAWTVPGENGGIRVASVDW